MKVSAISYSPVHFNARGKVRASKDTVYMPHNDGTNPSAAFQYHKIDYI